MEIYQLRTFVTVAQQGHLTQAAELLHLSQPAVTAQIKALEEDVGMPLFERNAGGMRLTRAGEELLPQAQSILAASREFLNTAKRLKGQLAGRAIIGVIASPEMLHTGAWIAALVRTYPMLDIQIRQGVTGAILNQVRKKEIDAGFFIGKNPYVNVNTVPLGDIRFRLVVPGTYRERVIKGGLKELGKIPWLGLSPQSCLNKLSTELWRDLNITPKRSTDIDHIPVMESLMAAGLGAVLMREDDAARVEKCGIGYMVPDVIKTAPLQFIYPADRAGDPILEVLLGELEREWRMPG